MPILSNSNKQNTQDHQQKISSSSIYSSSSTLQNRFNRVRPLPQETSMLSNFEKSLEQPKQNSSIENSPIVIKSSNNPDSGKFEDTDMGSGFAAPETSEQNREPENPGINLRNAKFEVVKLSDLPNPTSIPESEIPEYTTNEPVTFKITTESTTTAPTQATTLYLTENGKKPRLVTKQRDEVEPGKIVIIPANQNNNPESSSIENTIYDQVLQKLEKYGSNSLTEEEQRILRQDIRLKHHRSDTGARDHSPKTNREFSKPSEKTFENFDDIEVIEDNVGLGDNVGFDDVIVDENAGFIPEEETTTSKKFPSKPLTTTEVIAKATENGETDQQRGPDGTWKENRCTMNTFEKCLNGGYCMPKVGNCLCKRGYTGERCELSACGPTHTLINGTCDVFDLLVVHVQTPGLHKYLTEYGIPLRQLSSNSHEALGARSMLRSHIYEKMVLDGPKISVKTHRNEENAEKSDVSSDKPKSDKFTVKDKRTSSSSNTELSNEITLDLDDQIMGIDVEWFNIDAEIDAKIKISLPLGTGWDLTAWEGRLATALKSSLLVDWQTIHVEDFDECATQHNRCKAKNSVICENLPGSFQCRCLGSRNNGINPKCQDPCLTEKGEPFCLNKGRCKPVKTRENKDNWAGMNGFYDWPSQYKKLDELLNKDEIYDYTKQPMCYCTDSFHGNRCQFEYVDDSSLLVAVWSISGVLFGMIVGFLVWKIYKLVKSTADLHDDCTIQSSTDQSHSVHGIQPPTVNPRLSTMSRNTAREQTGYGNMSRPNDGNDVEAAAGAFTNTGQQIPRHIYAFY